MKILIKILWALIYILPAALFFSYHPIISLGSNSSMNFEFSVPLVWLLIFNILSFILLILIWRNQLKNNPHPIKPFTLSLPGLSDRRFFLLAIFPLYLTISVFWSANPLRGLLTAGIVWLIFFAIFSMLYLLPLTVAPRRFRTRLLLVMFIATVFVCHFCYAQSVMDMLGLSRDATLLCPGCTYHSFGFPHPSGFAIEPQFMGNLLLAPTLIALYLVAFRPKHSAKTLLTEANHLESTTQHKILHDKIKLPTINVAKWQTFGLTILAGYLSMTLFFTFSRGAIYAFAIGILILLIFALKRHSFRWSLIAIPVVSFLLSLGLQGTFSAVGPTAETFVSGITKSIHHLSLGIIDLRPKSEPSTPSDNDNPAAEDTSFDGYVAESTNIRLNLNHIALQTWLAPSGHYSTQTSLDCSKEENGDCRNHLKLYIPSILFGVGLGGAGTAMHKSYPTEVTSPKEIVQNEYFSLLLETGLVGILLAIFGLFVAFFPNLFSSKFLDGRAAPARKPSKSQQTSTALAQPPKSKTSVTSAKHHKIDKPLNLFLTHPVLPLLVALIVAYLITLNFFSGLPNALQIYLMPPLLYLIFSSRPHKVNLGDPQESPTVIVV